MKPLEVKSRGVFDAKSPSAELAFGNNAEATGTTSNDIDFLSNGIKIREDNGDLNASGATYIYAAFAKAPFVNSNGVPCNAR